MPTLKGYGMVLKTGASEQNNMQPGTTDLLAIGSQYFGGLKTWKNPAGTIAGSDQSAWPLDNELGCVTLHTHTLAGHAAEVFPRAGPVSGSLQFWVGGVLPEPQGSGRFVVSRIGQLHSGCALVGVLQFLGLNLALKTSSCAAYGE